MYTSEKPPKQKASDLFHAHYMIVFDSDTDKGEEITVSILAIKLALATVDAIENELTRFGAETDFLQNMDSEWRYWEQVRTELKNM